MNAELMRQVDELITDLELLRRRVKWDDWVLAQMRDKAGKLPELLLALELSRLADLVWDEGL